MTARSAREPLPVELVRAAADGSLDAFGALVARCQDMAVAYAFALLGDLGEAEDAAQEAFVDAFRELPRLREPGAFIVWLRRILYKRCDRRFRVARPALISLEEATHTATDEPSALDRLTTRETMAGVRHAVRALPDEQRMIVVLHYFAGSPVREIAELLEIPPGTVKSRLHSARTALRDLLTEMTDDLHDHRPSRDERFLRRVTALLAAVRDDKSAEVERLVAVDPGLVSHTGPHPSWGGEPRAVHVAAEWGHTAILARLLDAGADPNDRAKSYGGWSPLLLAIVKDHPDTIDLLLRRGAEPDVYAASGLGDVARLSRILARDPGVARRAGPGGNTALHFAASVLVARLLLDAGADPRALNQYGATPARSAAYGRRRRTSVARLLLCLTGEDDVFLRAAIGDVEGVSAMVDRDPSLVHATDGHLNPAMGRGATALHLAAAVEELQVMRLLLDRGADVSSYGEDGSTPLHHAAYHGRIRAVELLLEHGADPTLRDRSHDSTPFGWATFFERRELVAWMTARGLADASAQ